MALEVEVGSDPFTLAPIPPSPHGSIRAEVTCRTSRAGGPRTKHPVTIDADWTLTTPHDLALERVAAAMGGYLSCLDLADRGVPALREVVQRQARRVVPLISRDIGGRWTHDIRPPGCTCDSVGYASASEAAAHLRSVWHVACEYGIPPRVLERLIDAVFDAYDTLFFEPPADAADARFAVREDRGVQLLWDSGLHPDTVVAIHGAVWPDGPPLPVWFYLGAMSRRPALAWVAQTLRQVPDEDIAVWLSWTNAELDHVHPDARTGWLQAGVPRNAIAALADGSYTPIEVAMLAKASGRSLASAALTLAAWHRARCHPSVEDIAVLDQLDVDRWYEPSAGAIDWIMQRTGRRGAPTRTEVGLLLAVCGTRAGAMLALSRGIHDPRGAAALLGVDPATNPAEEQPDDRRLAHQ